MTSSHNEDSSQASLAELVLSDQLTPDEYFSIALSSSTDVSSAQTAISRVLTRIKNDQKKRVLQELYNQIFKQPEPTSEMSSPSNDSGLGPSDKSTETAKENSGQHNNRKKKKKKSVLADGSPKPTILWLRRDLRLYDNPALVRASANDEGKDRPVIPVFIWDEKEEEGGAPRVWLRRALHQLNQSLVDAYDSRLILRKGSNTLGIINELLQETGAKTVVWTALYEPWLESRDQEIRTKLEKRGVEVHVEHSYLLHRPDEVEVSNLTKGIGSVTHFMECCRRVTGSRTPIGTVVDPPAILKKPAAWPSSCSLEDLKLYVPPVRRDGSIVDWAKDIHDNWSFSEDGGYRGLQQFLEEDVVHYEKEACRADQAWTSVTSPFLHWGQLSPRTVLHEALAHGRDATKFRRKLAWRDMAYWIFTLFPNMHKEPIRPQYADQWWSKDKVHLKAWQRGRTGYPLVDAGMRQLWSVGWMNNYLRHVVASFLISYLRISWVEGYLWFQDTLLDADMAINAMMWQNGGMSGLDQWNFVMHPVDAALTCDPKGDFVKKWVPELAKLPERHIHCPWKAPPSVLARAGVVIGQNYPDRVIKDLESAREGSLKDISEVRRGRCGRSLSDPHSGRDLVRICLKDGRSVTVPVITRREFIYRTLYPDATDNPYTAVLKGYVSRKRDEEVERLQRVDFMSGILSEEVNRFKKDHGIPDDDKPAKFKGSTGSRNRFKHKLDKKRVQTGS